MDFTLTEEQQVFRNMAREFSQRNIEAIAKETDHNETFPQQVVPELAQLGLLGMTVPQDFGGLGLDHIDYAIVTEEIARGSLSVAMSIFGAHCVVGETIAAFGSPEQKQKYLPNLCQGTSIAACALSEAAAGFNANAFATKAQLQGDSWVLDGEKNFVINGGIADVTLVISKAADGLAAFLVEKGAAGVSATDIKEKGGLRAANIADISFKGCRLPAENLLGKVGDGAKIAKEIIDATQFAIAAGCVGASQGCIDLAVKYAEGRVVFGKAISNYDMIQAWIGDMIVGTEAARLLTYQVGNSKDKGQPFSRQLSMARVLASDVALKSATYAIQVHGAYGFGKEYDIERYFRDIAEVIPYAKGPADHKLAVARSAFGIGA